MKIVNYGIFYFLKFVGKTGAICLWTASKWANEEALESTGESDHLTVDDRYKLLEIGQKMNELSETQQVGIYKVKGNIEMYKLKDKARRVIRKYEKIK